jgi:hypothetical protein
VTCCFQEAKEREEGIIMKDVIGSLIIILLSISFAYASSQDRCKILFEELYPYSISKTVSDPDFQKCRNIVKQLMACNYGAHIIEKDGKRFIGHFLTPTYGDICRKTSPDLGIPAYIEYLIENKNSAEELLSFSFEHLFELYPEKVLKEIQIQDSSLHSYLLDKLVWGFLNNSRFEEQEAKKRNRILQRPVLNDKNYREVFNITYPDLTVKYEKYQTFIDYMLEGIKKYFQWLEKQGVNYK